jgi:hypothetical protein
MKTLKLLGLLSLASLIAPFAHGAEFGVGIGVNLGAAPVCRYGYYNYAPYACAPAGFYGADWFSGGVFLGAGPWFHGHAYPAFRGSVARGGFYGRVPAYGHPAFRGDFHANGHFDGGHGVARGSEGFHGGGNFHGGGGFHGGNGWRR